MHVDVGSSPKLHTWGFFSHDGYVDKLHPDDPSDTWVAQAGAGAGEDEGDESAAAAGASSNPY